LSFWRYSIGFANVTKVRFSGVAIGAGSRSVAGKLERAAVLLRKHLESSITDLAAQFNSRNGNKSYAIEAANLMAELS
jgi:hypothetical protein